MLCSLQAAAAAGKAAAAVALTLTGSGEATGMQNGHGSMRTFSGRVNAAMIQQVCPTCVKHPAPSHKMPRALYHTSPET